MKTKSKIGWARKSWYEDFKFKRNGEALLQISSILKPSFPIQKLETADRFIKVRITIEELKCSK